MEAQNKTDNQMRVAIGAVVVISLCGALMIYDLLTNRLAMVSELSARVNDLKQSNDQSLALQNIVSTTKGAHNKLNLYFITRATVGNFIGELDSYGERANVSLTLSAPSVEKDKQIGAGKYLQFNLRAEGEFDRAIHFLELIETMPYKIKVTSMTMGRLDGGSTKSKVWYEEITFNLISYIDN
ncbi:MAG: hypothetical protein HY226_02570 [Candidatus Vogelbacteria bacterium]|nr:hypothetical protein [Candidatus Vogelbacteria bacterium]